jgi:anhydro-N-acetylmuramic acid kinase
MFERRSCYMGLMSGTSLDGIDVVITQFGTTKPFSLLASHTYPMPETIKQQLLTLSQQRHNGSELNLYAELDVRLGRLFASACQRLLQDHKLQPEDIIAIGSHGQTLRHYPDSDYPTSLQIGDPNIISQQTGITTVADFRRRDMAAGGQGAPLVPPFHKAMFASQSVNRVILNIGGIANITFLPAQSEQVYGFDTGPGNGLLDDWCLHHFDRAYDQNGELASQGKVCTVFLQQMLKDPFFILSPPKSTGREYFSYNWVVQQLDQFRNQFQNKVSAIDVLSSLTELTARSIAQQIRKLTPYVDEVLVCGGGMQNTWLIDRIGKHLAGPRISSTEAYHLHPDWVEASAFAWLAQQTINGLSGNLPNVTGAEEAIVLGGIWPGKSFYPRLKRS